MIFTFFLNLSVLSEFYKLSTTYFYNRGIKHYFYIRKQNRKRTKKTGLLRHKVTGDDQQEEPPGKLQELKGERGKAEKSAAVVRS